MDSLELKTYEENRKLMEICDFYRNKLKLDQMSDEQKDLLARVIITLKFKKNEEIVTEGDPSSSFYLIKEGTASYI